MPTAAALFERLPRPLRRHRLMTGWMRLTREDPLQLVRIRDESFGYADMRNGFLRLIVIDGDYEADFFAIADTLLAEGGVFLDVGAHHGLFSFGLAGRHGGKVEFHLFEPNPELVESIRRSRSLYPQMRCRTNQVGVSDKDGIACFSIDRTQSGMSHLDEAGEVQIPTTTIDRYLSDNGIARVDLMKVDIEGYELLALRGAEQSLKARRVRSVYFEYCEKWLARVGKPGEVIDFLDSTGFTTCLCRPSDHQAAGGATHTIARGLPGHGAPLLPLHGRAPPASTDLLAVPREALSPL
jgi:FkbM family methyltransferase